LRILGIGHTIIFSPSPPCSQQVMMPTFFRIVPFFMLKGEIEQKNC